MGVVYKAFDIHLDRPVAIKVLPAEAVANPDRKRRFTQEAKAASALNHPNIVHVYDIDSSDGADFIAMEYVPGKTLDQFTARRALPAKEALAYGIQIADALATAHNAGIVHRDIKPGNIIVTEKGMVKVLDFGLAKLTEAAGSGETQTRSIGATRPGAILGTVAYMSPEQAAGKPVDARSDVFAFGVVLHELLAGDRPFSGKSDVDVLHAILHDPPRSLPDDLSAELRITVEKALEKDPADRYQSMSEVIVDLRRAQRAKPPEPRTGAAPRVRRWPMIAAGIAAAVLSASAIGAWLVLRSDLFWKNPLANAEFTRLTDFEGTERDADISRDGKLVVFVSDRDGTFDAWVHQLGTGEFVNLTKGRVNELMTESNRNVGFTADSAQVWLRAFTRDAEGRFSRSSILLMPTLGGTPRPFLEKAINAAWSPDRSKIVFHGFAGGDPIFIADRNGSNPKQIYIDRPGVHCHFPTWSSDGRFIYFVKGIPPRELDIWRIPYGGGTPERITWRNSTVGYPTFLDDRTLVYTAAAEDGSGSWLYSIDVQRRVSRRVSSGVEQYISVAATTGPEGRPRLVASVANPSSTLWTVPLSGSIVEEIAATRVKLPTVRALSPRFGPDYIVYLSSRGGGDGLWKWSHGVATELWNGSEGPVPAAPAVSVDGAQICFSVRKRDHTLLYLINADGTNLRSAAEALDVRGPASWSADGKWIAVSARAGSGPRIFKVAVDGGAPVRLTEEDSSNPVCSPNG